MSDVKNSSLATNLVSYWEMEEASGTRVDSHASADLTDNNTVGQGTGIQGNCADLESTNSEYFSVTDSTLAIANNFSVSLWFKQESASTQVLFEKGDGSDPNVNYRGYVTAGGDVNFSCIVSGSFVTAQTSSTPVSIGNWYHFVGVKRSSGTGIELYLNGSSVATGSGTGAAVNNTAHEFKIGGRRSPINLPWDGLIDEFGIWSRVLSTSDISTLYNSGAGIPYDAGGATRRIFNIS